MVRTVVNTDTCNGTLGVGDWHADRDSGELTGPSGVLRLEPKVMDLLFLLAAQPGQVLTRERIMEALWPGMVVGEDSLARTVSKLRQALGDDAKAPRYIETISKRGYRLLAEVVPAAPDGMVDEVARLPGSASTPAPPRVWVRVWGTGLVLTAALLALGWTRWRAPQPMSPASDYGTVLVARADDYYFQYTRADNESAIELYQRVLELHPDDVAALAGLANALVQRAIRWPDLPSARQTEFTRLGDALANGHLAREPALQQLRRAQQLAERAVELAPGSAATHKALGLVSSAQGHFEAALASNRRALALDPDAWGPMINIADLLEITGRGDEALPYFEQAYAAMGRVYERNPVQVRPWHAALGVLIADRYRARGDFSAAETWYRRVLGRSPLHPAATRGLAGVLRAGGDADAAERLCTELVRRLGHDTRCE